MKFLPLLVSSFVFLTFSACSVKEFKYLEENQDQAKIIKKIDNKTYNEDLMFQWKIASGDRLKFSVYNQSSSNQSGQLTQLLGSGGQQYVTQRYGDEGMLVSSDGIVNLPLIGDINLLGLTEKEAAQALLKKYKLYLKHPYVAVKILNQRLFVVGEVRQPGPLLVGNGTMTLFEALSRSGDLTDYANRTNIRIIRGSLREPEIREINLNDFNSIKYASLILRPNDILYVEPRDARSSMVGANEELPFWSLIGSILAPFTGMAVIYGVTQ